MQELAVKLEARGINTKDFAECIGARTEYGSECDHTFKHTLAYLKGRSDVAEIIALFQVHRILCDCELGLNFFASLED